LIEEYSKILYLDTDIIIKQDITPVLELDIDDKLYAIQSGTINSPSFGVYFFDFNTIDKNTTGINSGTLLFKNSDTMKTLFLNIREHIKEYTDAGRPVLYCMDQPFINYGAIKNNLHNNELLNPHVSLYEDNNEVTNY
jgi:lipopolysaccharide biosynthesis glycosyltransferase